MAPHAGVSGLDQSHGMASSSDSGGSSSRRRNTVQTEPGHGLWQNPVVYPYNPTQLPYQLQLQLAYSSQFAPGLIAPQLLPSYSSNHTNMAPPPLPAMQQQSRSRSPQKGARPASRSPERRDRAGEPLKQLGAGSRSSVNIRNNQTWSARSQNKTTSPPIALPLRPSFPHSTSMSSQLSSSLPSTPQQYPRQMTHSRSPSPSRLLQASPRSSYSEASSPHPTSRPFRSCRFEIGMAASRRRMPYSLGIEKLEPPTGTVQATLSAEDDKKLTQRMNDLYKTLLPTAESEERRTRFIAKLQSLLDTMWPGKDMKVHVFGSTGNSLSTKDSDGTIWRDDQISNSVVDVCITTPTRELDRICKLADALDRNGMSRVVCVSNAKVPIVKIWDPELNVACDMNVNNTLALENTRMIKTYVDIDERVRPLAMIIKYWTRQRVLNDAAMGGTLSSYTWICMIINFLQTRKPPILPSLHKRKHKRKPLVNGVDVSFDDDITKLRGYGKDNKESIGSLLFHFFRRYGYEIDFEQSVMSVREGKIISKTEKGWHLRQNNQLGIEEPFNTDRNLGNTADDTSVRGLHLEFRRAFDLLAENADLAGFHEEYVFPVLESSFDRPIFERPVPQPLPVLSRSSSRGRNLRGGYASSVRLPKSQSANGWGSSLPNRRASSGMAYSNYGTPYLGGDPAGGFLPHTGLPEIQPLPVDLTPEAIETRIRHAEAQFRYLQQRLQLEQTQLLQLRQQQLQHQQKHGQQQNQQIQPQMEDDDDDKQSKDSSSTNGTAPHSLQSMYGSPVMMPFQNNMFMSHPGMMPVYPLDGNGMVMLPQQNGFYQGMPFGVPFTPQNDSHQASSPLTNGVSESRPNLQRQTTGSSSTTLQSESQPDNRSDTSVAQSSNALGLTGFDAAAYQGPFVNGQQQYGPESYEANEDGRTPVVSDGREYYGFMDGGKLNPYLPEGDMTISSGQMSSSQMSNGSIPDRLLSPFSLPNGTYQDAGQAPDPKQVEAGIRQVSSTHYDDSPVLLDSSTYADTAVPSAVLASAAYVDAPVIDSIIASPSADAPKTNGHRHSLPHQLLGRPPVERVKSDKSVAQLSHSFVEATKSSPMQPNGVKADLEGLALDTKKHSASPETSPKTNSTGSKAKNRRHSKSNISYAQQLSGKSGQGSTTMSVKSPKAFPANGETYANKLDSGRDSGAKGSPTSEASSKTVANANTNGHSKGSSVSDAGGWQTTKKRGKKRSSLPNTGHHEANGPDGERKGG